MRGTVAKWKFLSELIRFILNPSSDHLKSCQFFSHLGGAGPGAAAGAAPGAAPGPSAGPLQAGGFCLPVVVGLTFLQTETGAPPLKVKSISASSTFSQGTPLLHRIFTASLLDVVPLMFLKLMLLNFTFDGVCDPQYFRVKTISLDKISMLSGSGERI